jgi:ferrochelatase
MKNDGIRRALAFVTSAYSSYSGCRQYRENIARAQEAAGLGAPVVDKIRVFHNHPGFIEALVDRVSQALAKLLEAHRDAAQLIYTAHSIPLAMAQGCRYGEQLKETGRLVAEKLRYDNWRLVYQSRSGPASQPWLEPDILDYLREYTARADGSAVVIAPIGFISDHMEILFDLDTQASELCAELGLQMVRAETVGTHPRFIRMIRELICERLDETKPRLALGSLPPRPDFCPVDCCLAPLRPAAG